MPIYHHGCVENLGDEWDVGLAAGGAFFAVRRCGGAAEGGVWDEAPAVEAEEVGGDDGGGVGVEVECEELEETNHLVGAGAEGSEVLCPCHQPYGEACASEGGGGRGGEEGGDMMDCFGGEAAEGGVVEGRWAR